MLKKFVSATVSAALCLMSAAPAMAQEYRSTGVQAPRGITATVNLRVPLGRADRARPSYGLTLGYGQSFSPTLDGRPSTRAMYVADIRVDERGERRNARLASFDLAHLDQDRRLNLTGSGKKTWLIIGGIIVAGVVICLAADCFEDDDEDLPSGTSG
ncbi:MAG: hypothetical protein ACXWUN_13085 [Allosphingosinicella sp.]